MLGLYNTLQSYVIVVLHFSKKQYIIVKHVPKDYAAYYKLVSDYF
jgi:hypothetical protein